MPKVRVALRIRESNQAAAHHPTREALDRVLSVFDERLPSADELSAVNPRGLSPGGGRTGFQVGADLRVDIAARSQPRGLLDAPARDIRAPRRAAYGGSTRARASLDRN